MQLVGYRTSWSLESLIVEKHSSNKAGNHIFSSKCDKCSQQDNIRKEKKKRKKPYN